MLRPQVPGESVDLLAVNISPLSPATALRLVLGLVLLILLAGCTTPSRPVGVTSPPPPLVGSAPISAYDDYALVIEPLRKMHIKTAIVVSAP